MLGTPDTTTHTYYIEDGAVYEDELGRAGQAAKSYKLTKVVIDFCAVEEFSSLAYLNISTFGRKVMKNGKVQEGLNDTLFYNKDLDESVTEEFLAGRRG